MKHYIRNTLYSIVLMSFSSAMAGAYEDFFRAVNIDNTSAVATLLQQGFDPNAPHEQGQVALFLAMREGSVQVAALLLAQPGIRVDAVNANDETPLMMAALRGNLAWAQRLIERGAQVNRAGWTPLHYAASGPEPKLVALMLDRGANVDARSPNGSTPLMMAARYGPEASALQLLERGASRQARNERDMTAADFARSAGRDALAKRLDAVGR